MKLENNQQAFFELARAGLWADTNLNLNENVDWEKVYQLAEEQSVIGVVLAGLEHSIVKPPQELLLQWIGEVQMIEQQNLAMNKFIERLVGEMREADIYTLLLKGQGIAQCYERPLWRPSGDVDFFLSDANYEKAKRFLLPLSSGNKPERLYSKELGMSIDPWYVEIHGTQRTGLSMRVDITVDEVQKDVFYGGNVRSWTIGKTQVFLPSSNNDVFFVFTHFIKHFYNEGMNLRQVCDWCRLLWTYRTEIDSKLLYMRLKKAGLMSEWNAFAAFAVNYLGMPADAMPLYNPSSKWSKKARLLVNVIINGDATKKIKYVLSIAKVFPYNTVRFSPCIFFYLNRLKIKEMVYKK